MHCVTHCSTLLRLRECVASLREEDEDVSLCGCTPALKEEVEALATPTASCST